MTTHPMLLISKGPSSNFVLTTYWSRDLAAAALFLFTLVRGRSVLRGWRGTPERRIISLVGQTL
jgi:hypothetical protein